ncbi:hypothetical protein [Pseudooceanicola algae]|uniref:Uncharacterized protein n=1 Tax=Pseudooceanicola algae TaxID=1537215 RepID=A0A418SCU0_9RHOB|nr:hypothetical protein [Pseudooceanicola algae]QPM92393.1 hypothetical protein PSAL_036570 [Pseudooceanicola algae]
MLETVKDNAELFQILASLATTFVWLVYLNIFLQGYIQQRRSSLLINRGGGETTEARCLISNMGAEPAYLLDVLVSLDGQDGPVVASVVDRNELRREEVTTPAELTGQGPIPSGGFVDIGSFQDVIDRARGHLGREVDPGSGLKLVAVAATNQARNIAAAVREFEVEAEEGTFYVTPCSVDARQIRSRRERRRITSVLGALQKRHGQNTSSLGAELAKL